MFKLVLEKAEEPEIKLPTTVGSSEKSKRVPAAATAAKSLQSCPDSVRPHRRQPIGLRIPGILQTRILEWVAIAFSNE